MPFVVLWLQAFRHDAMARSFLWVILGILIGGAWAMLAERWMDRRFGRVLAGERGFSLVRRPPPERARWGLAGAIYYGLSNVDEAALRAGGPSLLLLALASAVLWAAVHDWPFRKHLILFVALCSVAAELLPPLRAAGLSREQVELWLVAVWLSMRVLDLRLLLRAMPRLERIPGPAEP